MLQRDPGQGARRVESGPLGLAESDARGPPPGPIYLAHLVQRQGPQVVDRGEGIRTGERHPPRAAQRVSGRHRVRRALRGPGGAIGAGIWSRPQALNFLMLIFFKTFKNRLFSCAIPITKINITPQINFVANGDNCIMVKALNSICIKITAVTTPSTYLIVSIAQLRW